MFDAVRSAATESCIALRSVISYVTDAMFELLLQQAEVSADRLGFYDENRYREIAGTLPGRCGRKGTVQSPRSMG